MYKIELKKPARKAYLKLSDEIRKQIDIKLEHLAKAPYESSNDVKKLNGINNCYRLRVNDYGIVYRLYNSKLIIEIIKIAHRKEVYR